MRLSLLALAVTLVPIVCAMLGMIAPIVLGAFDLDTDGLARAILGVYGLLGGTALLVWPVGLGFSIWAHLEARKLESTPRIVASAALAVNILMGLVMIGSCAVFLFFGWAFSLR